MSPLRLSKALIMTSSLREPLSITTDVLVVGGGMAGAWAASAAAEAGAKVILADKGYCGTSGVTAAAGPGHWWVPPDPPEARASAVGNRIAAGLGLGEAEWMYRILDQTWRTLPRLAPHYTFGVDDEGRVNHRAVRGPEYMRALRQFAVSHGVTILDHSPVLELLARDDGSIGGAAPACADRTETGRTKLTLQPSCWRPAGQVFCLTCWDREPTPAMATCWRRRRGLRCPAWNSPPPTLSRRRIRP